MISELRTIDADQLWMSPCYKRPSLAIHFTWKPDWDSVRKVLPMIERAGPVRGPSALGQAVHPRAGGARQWALRRKARRAFQDAGGHSYDPKGKFRNAFLARNLYGA